MRKFGLFALAFGLALSLFSPFARASIFGGVRGIVHDSQHRPIPGAQIELKAANSDWTQSAQTNLDGEFTFQAVPIGDYVVSVSAKGFETSGQNLTVVSGTSPILHFELTIASVRQSATVHGQATMATVDSATPASLVDRQDIARTPGADRSNSVQMITDYVPGSYVTHDQLHVRGGHQVSWLIDGVSIPNTNIASNLGPQIDPKDIDYLEAQRGSYDAGTGDRTYGVFDVVPRSGFERNNDAELVMSLGTSYQTNDQFSLGGHTDRFAYYTSFNGNRSNLGLQTPIGHIFHDAENGYGGFASLMYNVDAKNQLRWVSSLRQDYYQIPYDPNDPSSSGLRDADRETDGYTIFSWVRTLSDTSLLTLSPFYHYNRANYVGSPSDFPIQSSDDRSSHYGGLQANISASVSRNTIRAGIYGFGQHDDQTFGAVFNDPSFPNFSESISAAGGLVEGYIDDKFSVTPWLTLMGGVRESHFSGDITENATSPRIGAALQIPRLHWVFRAFYGHYYQPPPLLTASGPLLEFANQNNTSFVPLHGERDEEHQFGVAIPFRGWTFDADTFKTRSKNYFDHNNVGESNIYFPITFDGALIQGWEATLRSPRIWRRANLHLAYSNQVAKARGPITGGLICYPPSSPSCQPNTSYGPVDHDQRNTLNVGGETTLPWRMFASANVYYGSGFTNGAYDPPAVPNAYLPGHTTLDLSIGKDFGERFTASLTALNVANRHLLIDNSQTFGGFHYNDPREIYVEVRYRFHY